MRTPFSRALASRSRRVFFMSICETSARVPCPCKREGGGQEGRDEKGWGGSGGGVQGGEVCPGLRGDRKEGPGGEEEREGGREEAEGET